jgi:uncharacterized protein DUF6624
MRPLVIGAALVLLARSGWGGEPAVAPRDPALRADLVRMAREDHDSGACMPASPLEPRTCRTVDEVRDANQETLRRIIAERGWPGRSLVGLDGSRAAWLIAQHADDDLAFQKQCLAFIHEAFLIGDMEAYAFAYLTDRICDHEGSPQMYGTQGGGAYGSPEDERRIDANRKAIGLEPWHEFVERLKKSRATQSPDRIASWE